jgi:hypothetical protein
MSKSEKDDVTTTDEPAVLPPPTAWPCCCRPKARRTRCRRAREIAGRKAGKVVSSRGRYGTLGSRSHSCENQLYSRTHL